MKRSVVTIKRAMHIKNKARGDMTTDLSLYMCTWNVGEVSPPENIQSLLNLDDSELPHLYAIGLQELSHNPANLMSDSVFDDPWTLQLTETLGQSNYVRIDSIRMLGIHLAVFVHRSVLPYVTGVERTYTRTGFGGYWGNKGAVSVRLDICGISMCIVNCHLTAHLPNVAERIRDHDQILERQTFNQVDTKSILDHDYIFWIGDLNFRIDDIPNAEVLERLEKEDREYLLQHDQLKKLMRDEMILLKFEEGPIAFNPTYKFDYGTDTYDSSKKQRKPGWCDRILWQVHERSMEDIPLGVRQRHYDSHGEYKESDHRAVSASFQVKVMKEPRPLPVRFNTIGTWYNNGSGCFSFETRSDFEVSKWDWIAVHKADFTHFKDYLTFVWAPVNDAVALDDRCYRYQVAINRNYLYGLSGKFCLSYFSTTRNCVVGLSNVFDVRFQQKMVAAD